MDDRLIRPGRPFDYRARDAATLLDVMLQRVPELLPEWTDHESETDVGRVLLELFAHMGDIIGYYTDAAANESFLGTAQTRRAVMEHLRLIGYRMSTAAPASAQLTVTVPKQPAKAVALPAGAAFTTSSATGVPSVRFEYTGPDRQLQPTDFTGPADGPFQVSIPVTEGRRIRREVIGTSDGTVNQRFPLLHPGIILRPGAVPDVTVDDGPGTDWVLQDTLAFSGPGQAHFTVEVDAQDRATVVFGERPPTPQADVRATYRVGGGEFGNVGADTISTIVPPQELAALPGAAVTNPAPANGGSEREAIEQAVRRAPTLFRAQGRAVTAADYETLALSFAGVGLARALARPGNLVELIVGPEGGGRVLPGMATDLAAYFEDKRPVGTRVMISSIDYVTIYVSVRVFPRPLYDRDQTRRQVEQAVRDVLSFDRAMLGQVVYLSAFYEAVEAVDGVTGATVTQFAKNPDDRTVEPSGRFLLGEDQAARAPVPDTPQGAWTPPELAAGVRVSMVEISL